MRLTKGCCLHVAIEVKMPEEATIEEAEEWLKHRIYGRGQLGPDHPLTDFDVEPYGDAAVADIQ
ncbi:MAG: hypothetical protein NXI18_19605 [Alphaproteobacteria bacterium]|nr:hypothetical protein [Alphaproteobacteria bacterium]